MKAIKQKSTGASYFAPHKTIVAISVLTSVLVGRVEAQPATTLQATLTPTVIITGNPGSLQQVQYSTNLANINGWQILSHLRLQGGAQPFYDATAASQKRFYRTRTVGVADTNLVWIPAGSFVMGTPAEESARNVIEGPQTMVTLTKGFFMGRYEVRNAEWLTFTGSLPIPGDVSLPNYLQRPVRKVTWNDAVNYCTARTISEINTGKIPAGWVYRLPSEAEWEYAARAGTVTPFAYGNELRADGVREDAAFDGHYPYPTNTIPGGPVLLTAPNRVGSYAANAFDLYDMHGNVREWCLDGGVPPVYPGGSVTDPMVTNNITFKVVRGGDYTSSATDCRSGARTVRATTNPDNGYGFRVVLVPADL